MPMSPPPPPDRPPVSLLDLARLVLLALDARSSAGPSSDAYREAYEALHASSPAPADIRRAILALRAAGLVAGPPGQLPTVTGAGQEVADQAWDRRDWVLAKLRAVMLTGRLDLGDVVAGLRWVHGGEAGCCGEGAEAERN